MITNIYNNNNQNKPNILHFQGQTLKQCKQTVDICLNNIQLIVTKTFKKQVTLVSCWTDDEKCLVYQQCKKSQVPLVNCIPNDYDKTQPWYMPNKIKFILNTLKNIKTDITIILDGYDVIIAQLNDILNKFKKQKYHILFNATQNNYPNYQIDLISNRYTLGNFKCFNAGCCIGYTKDLIKFYTECLELLEKDLYINPLNSEQFILRHVFKNYTVDDEQDFVFFDYECSIFQTMGFTQCDGKINKSEMTLNITSQSSPQYFIVTSYDKKYSEIEKKLVNLIYNEHGKDCHVYYSENNIDIPTLIYTQMIKTVYLVLDDEIKHNDATLLELDHLCKMYGVQLILVNKNMIFGGS